MCEFCNALKRGKEIEWYQRNTSTLDTSCDYISCDDCDGCQHKFVIKGIGNESDAYVKLSYFQSVGKGEDAEVVDSHSEAMLWNYCPICGDKISKETCIDEKIQYPLEIVE